MEARRGEQQDPVSSSHLWGIIWEGKVLDLALAFRCTFYIH